MQQPGSHIPVIGQSSIQSLTGQNVIPVIGQPYSQIISQPSYQPLGQNYPGAGFVENTYTPGFSQVDSDLYRSTIGKVRSHEVLTFKDADLVRTVGGLTTFATIGNLQVLYFEEFDRFVLSLNSWKFPLLRRIPVVSSEPVLNGPMAYTLPSEDGFYTVTLNKVKHLEALQNFETILINNSRFSYKNPNIPVPGTYVDAAFNDQAITSTMQPAFQDPLAQPIVQPIVQPMAHQPLDQSLSQPLSQPLGDPIQPGVEGLPFVDNAAIDPVDYETAQPHLLRKRDRLKRGIQRAAFKMTKGLSRKDKKNINMLQIRDLDSIKRSTEIMAPLHMYPRQEAERWFSFQKVVASRLGFEPEGTELDSTLISNRMRGYGSVDLGQGIMNPCPMMSSLPMSGLHAAPSMIGSHHLHHDYVKPGVMDKLKAKIPGAHHYKGEKSVPTAFAHPTHPTLGEAVRSRLPFSAHNTLAHDDLSRGLTSAQIPASLIGANTTSQFVTGSQLPATIGSNYIGTGITHLQVGQPITLSSGGPLRQAAEFVSGQTFVQQQATGLPTVGGASVLQSNLPTGGQIVSETTTYLSGQQVPGGLVEPMITGQAPIGRQQGLVGGLRDAASRVLTQTGPAGDYRVPDTQVPFQG